MSPDLAVSVAAVLENVLHGPTFARSKRHAALLRFLASHQGSEIKETRIGHEFFGRPADYDPKVDAVVRAEMRRLRERLDQYYAAEGASDPWRLEIPKGAYELKLTAATPAPVAIPATPASPERPRFWLRAAVLVAAALLLSVIAWRAWPAPGVASVAVLPLNVTGDPAVADGLAREIASDLSRIAGLRVVGPEAAARAQQRDTPLPEIARRLNVDGILTGAAQTVHGRLRLQLQLTSAVTQSLLWSRTLERDLVDPFTLQNELASSVASAIHLDLLRKSGPPPAVSSAALNSYRQGRLLLDRRTALAIRQAAEHFRRAVSLAPHFADAWAALADALATLPDYDIPESGWVDEARSAARKAIELDPLHADAHTALGWIEFQTDLRAAAATRLLTRAVELNPNHLPAQRRLALVLLALKRFRESEQRLRTALRLDPLSPMIRVNLAELFYYQQDYAREEPELRAALELNPHLMVARVMLVNMLSRQHRCAETSQLAHLVLADAEASPWHPGLAGALARCGEPGPARDMYFNDKPNGAREMVAEFHNDWPAVHQYIARLARHQPGYARSVAIGPDSVRYAQYPPIRGLFDALERRIQRSE